MKDSHSFLNRNLLTLRHKKYEKFGYHTAAVLRASGFLLRIAAGEKNRLTNFIVSNSIKTSYYRRLYGYQNTRKKVLQDKRSL